MKITFLGAGSTVFARNVLGDCMCIEALRESEIALYDIDAERLNENPVPLAKYPVKVNLFKHQLRGANMALIAMELLEE